MVENIVIAEKEGAMFFMQAEEPPMTRPKGPPIKRRWTI